MLYKRKTPELVKMVEGGSASVEPKPACRIGRECGCKGHGQGWFVRAATEASGTKKTKTIKRGW